jgi:phosphoglycolate phosphatase
MEKADFTVENPGQIVDYVMQCSLYSDIERSLEANRGKITVIGVNGVDTSGKTQFSSKLKRFLQTRGHKVCLIHMDDFHNPSSIRGQGGNPIESYINNAFNLELLEKEILLPLKNEGFLDKELTLLDLESDQYNSKKRFYIDEEVIAIIEGVLLYREPIDKYFDLRIFLDISFDEVLRRAEIRDVPLYGEAFLKKYKEKYIPIQQRYISECRPIEKSDFVIDNTNYNRPERIDRRVKA